ncbi:MAG: GGDEF domain-containing protein [Myxococcota bacterium]
MSESADKGRRRQSNTHRIEERPDFKALPKDRCTLTMLTGPRPGAIHTLGTAELVLGRDDDLPWRIEDRGVSGRHARIYGQSGKFILQDMESTNGTFVAGSRVLVHELRDGDRIQLGEHTLIRVSLQDATEHEAAKRMYQAAVLDPLTGVYNRGHLEAVLVAEFAYAHRHKSPLTVAFVDLDHFTRVNNTYGHQAGDAVLRMAAQAISHAVRTEDLVARYGGEEFVLLARGIDINGGLVMAERVRRTLESLRVPVHGNTIEITGSVGVASYEAATPYATQEELIAAADRAVYRAKADGRNRVCDAIDEPDQWSSRQAE